MNRVLLLFYVVLTYLYTVAFDADRFVTETVHSRLKYSMNRGAHDAALQVNRTLLGQGKIVFDRPAAKAAFLEGLRANLQLGADLSPAGSSFLTAAPEVVFEDYVDHGDAAVTFPYSYVRPDRRIVHVLKGPAVIYQVRIKLPQTNRLSYDGFVYKTVIYEYPL
ncbi:hypothetical protein [Paenibacillus ginsengihumi]|uniref:hypothetical protein n=1 Tax=Paenibacillus ginsengihumi TaxID=431596 RepID=UPI00035CCFEA|nr:hypothetical protein [Paenibacillus ginsengihumi]